MENSRPLAVTAVLGALALILATAPRAQDDGMRARIEAALAMDYRSAENQARDANRDPVRAMEFCGLREDMKVIEFGPGAGWYTEILGPVLAEHGELHIANRGEWLDRLDPLLANEALSRVHKLPIDIDWNADKRAFDVGALDFSMTDADLMLNIREYHGFDDEGAAKLNAATFRALKPGGLYCVIDHTRRHMEADSPENRRRRDPVKVIKQVLDAGFEFAGYSEVFFRADDELRYEVGRKTVTGNTDRFALLFRKP